MAVTQPNKTKIATPNDIVMTKQNTALHIVNYFSNQFNTNDSFLEPCRGSGNIYNLLPSNKDYCEIQEGIDFLNYNNKVNWIITNPPFSIFDLFLLKSFDVADNVVFLCPLNKVFKSMKIDRQINNYGGIKEVIHIGTGGQHGFPFGFPVGYIHYQKGYKGDIKYTRCYN